MFPIPDDDDGIHVPLELAQQVIMRLHSAITETRADETPDGLAPTLERMFGLKSDCRPEDIPDEIMPEVMAYLETQQVTVGLGDLNVVLVFISNLMERLEMTHKFARYLHDNGHERIGTYLHTLAKLPTAPLE